MPRPRREDCEGAWQHVMNRGIDRAPIFRSDADRQIFLECLEAATQRYALQVHAYCLLGNHYHLMLFSEKGQLSDGMRFLSARFTQRINYRDNRDGPLFRGRFASVPIKDDAHLVCVSRYIHRNPVEAGLVREPTDWIGRAPAPTSAPRARHRGFARMQYSRCSGRPRGKSTEISSQPR
jgi:putative transposase